MFQQKTPANAGVFLLVINIIAKSIRLRQIVSNFLLSAFTFLLCAFPSPFAFNLFALRFHLSALRIPSPFAFNLSPLTFLHCAFCFALSFHLSPFTFRLSPLTFLPFT
jgi:hypothetical protein